MALFVIYALYYPRREILVFFVLPMPIWLALVLFLGLDLFSLAEQLRGGPPASIAFAAHLGGAAYGYLYKRYDLRWSRLLGQRMFRPKLRIVRPEPRDRGPTIVPSRPTPAPVSRPSPSTVFPPEQLDARVDEILAKIAREGRGSLTDEENQILQEASRRARPPQRAHPMSATVHIRAARPGDQADLVAFNAALAIESENKVLDRTVLALGVEQALAEPDRLRYWVAETGGVLIGQAAITREWSDWRNGWLWWFQSVYVAREWRRRGVFRGLFETIRHAAVTEGNVVGLRLYVENENLRAQRTYEAMGLRPGGYHVYEDIWNGLL